MRTPLTTELPVEIYPIRRLAANCKYCGLDGRLFSMGAGDGQENSYGVGGGIVF